MAPVETTRVLPPVPGLTGARLRLYEAAMERFGTRGYHAVSVRDLMASLGQNSGALYAHVPSKQHLLYELVRIGYEEHRNRLKEALLDSGKAPAEQIRALSLAHDRVHLAYPALARVISRESRALSEEQLSTLIRVRAESEAMFLDVIERGVRLGEFVVQSPRLAVLAIAAMGVRAAEWWAPDSPESASEVADTFADYAVKLLA